MTTPAIDIPQGKVFAVLRVEFITPKGSVIDRRWPVRLWQSAPFAMQVAHRWCAECDLATYAAELEIIRTEEEA